MALSSLWREVGKRLREARGEMNQTDFGKALGGYHQNKVSRYELAMVRPPLDYLVKVAEFKNLSLDWLIRGIGPGPSLAELGLSETRKRTRKF